MLESAKKLKSALKYNNISAVMPWGRGCSKSRDRNTALGRSKMVSYHNDVGTVWALARAFPGGWLVFQSPKHAKRPFLLSKRYGLNRRAVDKPQATVLNPAMEQRYLTRQPF